MLATHDLRWTTGFLEPYTFTRYNKYHREDGVFHMFGDKAEAQNGYGNWFRMNYICKFNPTTNQVIDVSLHKGRLPQ